jgi:signal transduction histidine kinase
VPATERGIRTSYELTPNLTVIGDHDALRRAAGNLLSNAVCLTTTTITIATGHQDGLGLAIVRQITESHDGRVTIHATIGTGTTFALWFPTRDRPYGTPPPELPTTPPTP